MSQAELRIWLELFLVEELFESSVLTTNKQSTKFRLQESMHPDAGVLLTVREHPRLRINKKILVFGLFSFTPISNLSIGGNLESIS
jgi:hypothetical protein